MFKSIAKWYNNLTEESNSYNHEETTKPTQPKYSILIQKNDYAYWLADRYGNLLRKVALARETYDSYMGGATVNRPITIIGLSPSRKEGYLFTDPKWNEGLTGYAMEHFKMSYNNSQQGNRFENNSTYDILRILFSTTIFSEEECVYITERIQGEFGMFPLIKGEVG